jgi:hypothetical protein
MRIAAGLAGALLLYVALFLYEDEELRLQNRLEALWRFINTLQSSSLSKEAAFLRETSRITNRGLDLLLGEKLFSVQLVAIAMCFSFVSILWFIAVSHFYSNFNPLIDIVAVVFLLLGLAPIMRSKAPASPRLRKHGGRTNWYYPFLIVLVLSTAVICERYWLGYDEWTPFLALGILGGTLSDSLFFVFFRWILRKVAGFSNVWTLGLCGVAMAAVGGLLVAPSISLQDRVGDLASGAGGDAEFYSTLTAMMVSATNWVDAICAVLAIGVMTVLLLHRILWPLIKRPLYAANRKQLIKNSKLLGTLGTACILYAFPSNPLVRGILHVTTLLKE